MDLDMDLEILQQKLKQLNKDITSYNQNHVSDYINCSSTISDLLIEINNAKTIISIIRNNISNQIYDVKKHLLIISLDLERQKLLNELQILQKEKYNISNQ